jgi:hypothetical protein
MGRWCGIASHLAGLRRPAGRRIQTHREHQGGPWHSVGVGSVVALALAVCWRWWCGGVGVGVDSVVVVNKLLFVSS